MGLPNFVTRQQNAGVGLAISAQSRYKDGALGEWKKVEASARGPRPERVGRDRMKPRQIPWKWLLLGLVILLLAGLVMLPRQFGDSARIAARVTDALSTWTGGDVKLTGPLSVRYFPDVAIKSGFEVTNASRLPLVRSITTNHARLSLDLAELLFGRIKIDAVRLLSPDITLKEVPSLVMGPDQTVQAKVVNLLSGVPVGVLRLRKGTMRPWQPRGNAAARWPGPPECHAVLCQF